MTNENEKLEKFKLAVFAEIDIKTTQIQQEAQEYKEQKIEKSKQEQLEKSYFMIQNKSEEIKKQCKREVAKRSLDAKRSLLIKRNEITLRVFENVKNKLLEYTKTQDYKQYLIKTIAEFSKINSYESIDILIRSEDMKFSDDIKTAYAKNCNVKEFPSIKVGGFIARNDEIGVYFDETLEKKLEAQKGFFIEHSQLNI